MITTPFLNIYIYYFIILKIFHFLQIQNNGVRLIMSTCRLVFNLFTDQSKRKIPPKHSSRLVKINIR